MANQDKKVKCFYCNKRVSLNETIDKTNSGLGYVCKTCDKNKLNAHIGMLLKQKKQKAKMKAM